MASQRTHRASAMTFRGLLLAGLLVAGFGVASPGCGDDTDGDVDAALLDAGADVADLPHDGSLSDAGPDGAADAATDGGVEVPLDGFGDITGACGVLDEMVWSSTDSVLFRNAIDLGVPDFDYGALSVGGQKIFDDGNLGGNSLHSEVFSYEVLYRCELAQLLKTEAEIQYVDLGGKKTDLLVFMNSRKVGVSVTRAYYYWPGPLPYADAYSLLVDKCADVLLSADNADPVDAWARSMLHVIAYGPEDADVIETAYAAMDATMVDETILLVTVTDGNDEYIY
jgi:hypothetical protein